MTGAQEVEVTRRAGMQTPASSCTHAWRHRGLHPTRRVSIKLPAVR